MAIPYLVAVHLIEGRDIKLRNGALPNPYAEVEVAGRVRSTFITQESGACLWNAGFSFEDVRLTPDQYKRATIKVRLRSANFLASDDVLGVYAFNLETVHQQSETAFQIFDTWIAVPDIGTPEKVAGHVRMTVTVLGPGDMLGDTGAFRALPEGSRKAIAGRIGIDTEDARVIEGAPDAALVIIPNAAQLQAVTSPQVDRKPYTLRFRIFRGEDVPRLDPSAPPAGGCNPYIVVRHGSEALASSVMYNMRSPVWNEEIQVPCFRTGHADAVQIELWHARTLASNVLIATHALSLNAIASAPLRVHWVNLYGPMMDSRAVDAANEGPGISGVIVSTLQSLLPFSDGPGVPRPSAYLGRLLMSVEVERDSARRGVRPIMRDIPPEPGPVSTLLAVRVLEVQGVEPGLLGRVRATVSFGPEFRVSDWITAPAGIATFDFMPAKPVFGRTTPLFRPSAPPYLQRQTWDVIVNVFTFSPVGGVSHVGVARIPAREIMRDWREEEEAKREGGGPRPVPAFWVDMQPAFRPAAEAIKPEEVGEADSMAPQSLLAGDGIAEGAGRLRLLLQAALIQRDNVVGQAQSHGATESSGLRMVSEDEDEDGGDGDGAAGATGADASPEEDGPGKGEGEGAAGAGALDSVTTGGRVVMDVDIAFPPMPLPSTGTAAAAAERVRIGWSKEDDVSPEDKVAAAALRQQRKRKPGEEADAGEAAADSSDEDGAVVRSGPRFRKRVEQGLMEPEVVVERKLFCAVYQARGLNVPPHVFLHRPYRARQRLRKKATAGGGILGVFGAGGGDEDGEDADPLAAAAARRKRKAAKAAAAALGALAGAEGGAGAGAAGAAKGGAADPEEVAVSVIDSAAAAAAAAKDPVADRMSLLGLKAGGMPQGSPALPVPPPTQVPTPIPAAGGGFFGSIAAFFGGGGAGTGAAAAKLTDAAPAGETAGSAGAAGAAAPAVGGKAPAGGAGAGADLEAGKGAPTAAAPAAAAGAGAEDKAAGAGAASGAAAGEDDDEAEEGLAGDGFGEPYPNDGLTVQLGTSLTLPHRTPPCKMVGPAPLWYHACVFPLRTVVKPMRQKRDPGKVIPPLKMVGNPAAKGSAGVGDATSVRSGAVPAGGSPPGADGPEALSAPGGGEDAPRAGAGGAGVAGTPSAGAAGGGAGAMPAPPGSVRGGSVAGSAKGGKAATAVTDVGEEAKGMDEDDAAFLYAYNNPRVRELMADDAIPPGFSVAVLLDGAPIARIPDTELRISAEPRWVPLQTTDSGGGPAGELLVWFTYDDEVLGQFERSTSEASIDDSIMITDTHGPAAPGASFATSLEEHWACAKRYGVPRDAAVGLSRYMQPWLPVLRPVDMRMFIQGARDLDLPAGLSAAAAEDLTPERVKTTEWRVEVRLPDAADATLSSGQWKRHYQQGCLSGLEAFQASVAASAARARERAAPAAGGGAEGGEDSAGSTSPGEGGEGAFRSGGGGGLDESAAQLGKHAADLDKRFWLRAARMPHMRFTPWQLQPPPAAQRLELDDPLAFDAPSIPPPLDSRDVTGEAEAIAAYKRTESLPLVRSETSVVVEGRGCAIRPTDGIGRANWARLQLTSPQMLTHGGSASPLWLPVLPDYAPEATVYLWRRSEVDPALDPTAGGLSLPTLTRYGWRGKGRWILVGASALPLQALLQSLPLPAPLRLVKEARSGRKPRRRPGAAGSSSASGSGDGGSTVMEGNADMRRVVDAVVDKLAGEDVDKKGNIVSPIHLRDFPQEAAPAVLAYRGAAVWAAVEPSLEQLEGLQAGAAAAGGKGGGGGSKKGGDGGSVVSGGGASAAASASGAGGGPGAGAGAGAGAAGAAPPPAGPLPEGALALMRPAANAGQLNPVLTEVEVVRAMPAAAEEDGEGDGEDVGSVPAPPGGDDTGAGTVGEGTLGNKMATLSHRNTLANGLGSAAGSVARGGGGGGVRRQDPDLVSTFQDFDVDMRLLRPKKRFFDSLNAREMDVSALVLPADPASSTERKLAAQRALREGWPLDRMRDKVKKVESGAGMGRKREVDNYTVDGAASEGHGRIMLRLERAKVYERYSAPVETAPWMNTPLSLVPLRMPSVTSTRGTVAGLLTGNLVVWMDDDMSLTLVQFDRRGTGEVVTRDVGTAVSAWSYVGMLTGAFSLLPCEAPYLAEPAEDGTLSEENLVPEPEDGLRRSIKQLKAAGYPIHPSVLAAMAASEKRARRGAGATGDADNDDAMTLATAPLQYNGGAAKQTLIPPWLALSKVYTPGAGVAIEAQQGRGAFPGSDLIVWGPHEKSFEHLRCRLVVYRGYALVDPSGNAVRTFLRVRVVGKGVDDENGAFWSSTEGGSGSGAPSTSILRAAEEDAAAGGDDSSGAGEAHAGGPEALMNPTFGREFVLDTYVPGRCDLVLEVWYYALTVPGVGASLIPRLMGSTRISLERRWNNPVWRRCLGSNQVPVETRCLYMPREAPAAPEGSAVASAPLQPPDEDEDETAEELSLDRLPELSSFESLASKRVPKGRVQMWLGLGSATEPLPRPPLDEERTRGPKNPPWELRLVVWTIQQNELGVKCPVYATADLLTVGNGYDGSRAAGDGERPTPSIFDLSFLWGGGKKAAGKDNDVVDPSNPLAKIDANLGTAYRTPTHPGRRGTGPRKVNLETNWRMKFRVPVEPPKKPNADGDAAGPVTIAGALAPRLRVRTWRHTSWYASDHLLGEAVFELQPLLAAASRSGNQRQDVGIQVAELQPVGHYGTKGRIWLQLSLVPEEIWRLRPAGLGRSDPNQDPYVPDPFIPPQFTLWERIKGWLKWIIALVVVLVIICIVVGVVLSKK